MPPKIATVFNGSLGYLLIEMLAYIAVQRTGFSPGKYLHFSLNDA